MKGYKKSIPIDEIQYCIVHEYTVLYSVRVYCMCTVYCVASPLEGVENIEFSQEICYFLFYTNMVYLKIFFFQC